MVMMKKSNSPTYFTIIIRSVVPTSAVGGISPYVRREQRRQAKNRKARFEEHIRMLEKQALSKDMNSDK